MGSRVGQASSVLCLKTARTIEHRRGNPQLSAKDDYPNYMRVNAPDVLLFDVSALVFRHFGFRTFDMFFCEDGLDTALVQRTSEKFAADDFRTNAYMFAGFKSTCFEPGSTGDIAVLLISLPNNESAWKEHREKKNAYDAIFNRALDFNAHAHMWAHLVGQFCASFDILSIAQTKGLIGTGHFWSGRTECLKQFCRQFVGVTKRW